MSTKERPFCPSYKVDCQRLFFQINAPDIPAKHGPHRFWATSADVQRHSDVATMVIFTNKMLPIIISFRSSSLQQLPQHLVRH